MRINLPKNVESILSLLSDNKFESYVVGGCVRDSILNRNPHDWDITTNATPDEIINVCNINNIKYVPTGLKHGTITLVIDDESYEVTTYRIDSNYSDHRHADEVTFSSSLEDDLSRRDFTINAMAYNHQIGLIDIFNGINDINNKIIRCVGNSLDRFNEDALRMLRCIRFACQLDFEIHCEAQFAMSHLCNTIEHISKERIRDELCKILISNKPSFGIRQLINMGLMSHIMPEIYDCINFQQYNKHHDKDVLEHILSVVDNSPNKIEIRLAALLHDIGKPHCFSRGEDGEGHFYNHHNISYDISLEMLKRLRFDNNIIKAVSILVKEHMSRYDHLRTPNIKRFITRVGEQNLNDLFELQIADIKSSSPEYQNFDNVLSLKEACYKILTEKQPLSVKDLAVNGHDLMALGFKPGKELGDILKQLLELVLDEKEPNEKNRLLEIVSNI